MGRGLLREQYSDTDSTVVRALEWHELEHCPEPTGYLWRELRPGGDRRLDQLEGVTALSTSDVWAVDLAAQSPSGFKQTLIEHWNAKQWSIVPSPDMNPQKTNPNSLFAVTEASPVLSWLCEPGIVFNKAIQANEL